ncbi:MAG: threonylcarbamoyl-AMP synthase [Actinobacteria bacterium]|nr:threonylcarbamoyl-AMP synthase [Actinomycetota bacterium]
MIRRFDVRKVAELERGLTAAAAAAKRGEVVIAPTESAYGLATDAFSIDGVNRLRELKNRGPDLPIPVMVGATMTVDGIVSGVSKSARELIAAFWPGALTLVGISQPTLTWAVCAAGDNSLSVRMPIHPVTWQLAKRVGPLALSGANIAGADLPTTCEEAVDSFDNAVGVYLDAGPLTAGVASTVVDITTDPPTLLRAGAVTLAQLRSICPDLIDPDEQLSLEDDQLDLGGPAPA